MIQPVDLPDPFESAVGTGFHTFETEIAFFPIDDSPAVSLMDCFGFADLHAFEAGHTISIDGHQFRVWSNAFRVAAPFAVERAALQEDRGPDAGTVVQRESLNVKNETF